MHANLKAYTLELEGKISLLRSLFEYSPNSPSGIIRRRQVRSDHPAGEVCGSRETSTGYWRVFLTHGGRRFRIMAHRLVFILCAGPIPEGRFVDHKDGNPSNNRIENLQSVLPPQNHRLVNRIYKNNRSGFIGVSWHKGKQRWRAMFERHGKNYNLGMFKTKEEAAAAYDAGVEKWATENGESVRFTNKQLTV